MGGRYIFSSSQQRAQQAIEQMRQQRQQIHSRPELNARDPRFAAMADTRKMKPPVVGGDEDDGEEEGEEEEEQDEEPGDTDPEDDDAHHVRRPFKRPGFQPSGFQRPGFRPGQPSGQQNHRPQPPAYDDDEDDDDDDDEDDEDPGDNDDNGRDDGPFQQEQRRQQIAEKDELLYQIHKLRGAGVVFPPGLDRMTDLETLRFEYNKVKYDLEAKQAVKFYQQLLMASVSGVEYVTTRYNPLDLRLDGWSSSVMSSINDYDPVLDRLHSKYGRRYRMQPEVELLMMLGGSAMMHHLSRTMAAPRVRVTEISEETGMQSDGPPPPVRQRRPMSGPPVSTGAGTGAIAMAANMAFDSGPKLPGLETMRNRVPEPGGDQPVPLVADRERPSQPSQPSPEPSEAPSNISEAPQAVAVRINGPGRSTSRRSKGGRGKGGDNNAASIVIDT
ncbi:MAG: hypothetical protein CMA10_04640 [Euryarchaeota archaeon]|nr:hypothetical protein [Euryarchaeota archaeon]|tara:strand:- start:19736 stop:21064 length:1329 start_codon:yes stop_codon:yes gene_type:complete